MSIFIPGRIEFLGKHNDYCGGRSIVCAIDRGFTVDIEQSNDALLWVENRDTGEMGSVAFDPSAVAEGPGWMLYPQTVARRVAQNFSSRPLRGVRISFSSNLPKAAGLSSSSALIVATFIAISEINELISTEEYAANISSTLDLAGYLGCIENGQTFRGLVGQSGVGTFGGSQDHTAILTGKSGMLSRFAYCPVRHDLDIVMPEGFSFVIASSGIHAEKTGAAMEKYNRVSLMVSEIVKAWQGSGSTLAEIVESAGLDEVERFISSIDLPFPKDDLIDRVRQFYSENYAIVGQVSDLLLQRRVDMIGGIIDISQRNAERYLKNQTDETVFLQRSARQIGAAASSAFGAGFGGSVYALVESTDAERFSSEWKEIYLKRFPHLNERSEFFVTHPSEFKSA